jgi:hypothetical protein
VDLGLPAVSPERSPCFGAHHGEAEPSPSLLTFGQQSWLRLLNVEHHQVLAGTDASMAPGFKTAQSAAATKQSADYRAHR